MRYLWYIMENYLWPHWISKILLEVIEQTEGSRNMTAACAVIWRESKITAVSVQGKWGRKRDVNSLLRNNLWSALAETDVACGARDIRRELPLFSAKTLRYPQNPISALIVFYFLNKNWNIRWKREENYRNFCSRDRTRIILRKSITFLGEFLTVFRRPINSRAR